MPPELPGLVHQTYWLVIRMGPEARAFGYHGLGAVELLSAHARLSRLHSINPCLPVKHLFGSYTRDSQHLGVTCTKFTNLPVCHDPSTHVVWAMIHGARSQTSLSWLPTPPSTFWAHLCRTRPSLPSFPGSFPLRLLPPALAPTHEFFWMAEFSGRRLQVQIFCVLVHYASAWSY